MSLQVRIFPLANFALRGPTVAGIPSQVRLSVTSQLRGLGRKPASCKTQAKTRLADFHREACEAESVGIPGQARILPLPTIDRRGPKSPRDSFASEVFPLASLQLGDPEPAGVYGQTNILPHPNIDRRGSKHRAGSPATEAFCRSLASRSFLGNPGGA